MSNKNINKKELGLFVYCIVMVMLLFAMLTINPHISWREKMSDDVDVKELQTSIEELQESCDDIRIQINQLRGETYE
jgi:hypothetical protein